MTAGLQKAIDCLQIRDVYLRESNVKLAEGCEPKYASSDEDFELQFMHIVKKGEVFSLTEDGDDIQIFRVHIELGARWVSLGEGVAEQDEDMVEDKRVIKARIEATFLAEYQLKEDPGQDALNAFALNNASYHIWPYWREYLMSQCMRMNMPKVVLPTVQFAANNDQTPDME